MDPNGNSFLFFSFPEIGQFRTSHATGCVRSRFLVICNYFCILWVGQSGDRSVQHIQRKAVSMQMVFATDWNTKDALDFHVRCSTAGFLTRQWKYLMHTRSFQKCTKFKGKNENKWVQSLILLFFLQLGDFC